MKRHEINKLEAAEILPSETQSKFKTFAFALYDFLIE